MNRILFRAIMILSVTLFFSGCDEPHEKARFENIHALDALKQHSREFKKRIETVTVDSKIFKEMLGKLRNPLATIATKFEVTGGKMAFLQFMALFDPAYEE